MKSLEDVINKLPMGVSALTERVINNKYFTFIIIKDDFKEIFYAPNSIEFQCKSAIITNNEVISAHMILKLEGTFNTNYYPFHYNFYNSDSLKLATNLCRQKKICIVLSNKYNEYKTIYLDNILKGFFKKYLSTCIGHGYQWSEDEYKKSMVKVISTFPNMCDLWNRLGEAIILKCLKN